MATRHTDPGPAAQDCRKCRTTHRPGIACPKPGRWLVTGTALPRRLRSVPQPTEEKP